MGQRSPIRDEPLIDEVEAYIMDMLLMMARLAGDAELFDLSARLQDIVEPFHLGNNARSDGPIDHRRANIQ